MSKSNHDIVQETLELADRFYAAHGYISRPGFRYDQSSHPQERFMWVLACEAQDLLCETDAQNALDELEGDDDE
jgi:SNF2 family DNA or RNA helicase